MSITFKDYQESAISRMHNGCILDGGVGCGKSRTSLGYYYKAQNGSWRPFKRPKVLQDLYIITTPKKRDDKEWDSELAVFELSRDSNLNAFDNAVVVDSWNNIKKYVGVAGAFFIFDEQRAIGSGAWSKAFLKITQKNNWILLSATPGDVWKDYIPVFVANGFYKNKTQFTREHVIYKRFVTYPAIDHYINTKKLERLRDRVLVYIDYKPPAEMHDEYIDCKWDKMLYKEVMKTRFNPFKEQPIRNAGELCYTLRKVVNSDVSRLAKTEMIARTKKRIIIFYNFDYELELLKGIEYDGKKVLEYNGHKHDEIPTIDECAEWVYLVQYTAGCEGWNCVLTDTVIFFSQNYSYKVLAQAKGRINRMNTEYSDLWYYHLRSGAKIDLSIARAIKAKKKFNQRRFCRGVFD